MIALANMNLDLSASSDTAWLWELSIGLLAVSIVYWILAIWIRRASREIPVKKNSMKVILLLPLKILFVAIGLYYSLSILGSRFGLVSFVDSTRPFIKAFLVICLSWTAFRWKKSFVYSLNDNQKMISSGLNHTVSKVLSIVLFVVTVLVILQVFHLDIWPLLAFGGIGAAAVGFAAKDVISNFCSGLMLSLTRPFVVGDQVIMPSLSVEGPVEEIGWYLTVVRDKDKRPVYLPNAIFANALVINSSRMQYRRILDEIYIPYTDFHKIQKVMEMIRMLLKDHPLVAKDITPLVHLNGFKESSLCIYLDVYVSPRRLADYLQLKEGVYMRIYEILETEGIKPACNRIMVSAEGWTIPATPSNG